MADCMWKSSKEPLRRSLPVLMLLLGLILSVASCGEPQNPTPELMASPSLNADRITSTSPPSPEAGIINKLQPPPYDGAASPSVEERIYRSDIVVRASLQSTGADSLRFSVIEYLKGVGASEIVVLASTFGRNTNWDDREALLFLNVPGGDRASHAKRNTAPDEFAFYVDEYYTGDSAGYTVDMATAAWLPAAAEVKGSETSGGHSSAGASGITSNPEFLAELDAGNGSPATISLADLRSKIAWIEGGSGIEGYDECISRSLGYMRHERDWEVYHRRPRTVNQSEGQVTSGASAGTVAYDYGSFHGERAYHKFWLTGRDADLFRTLIIDDDEVASNGYRNEITSSRPLPRGGYRFTDHTQGYYYMPCNFTPENHKLEWVITAVAPSGVVYEAFFDPATIGSAVGADAANGMLKPQSFSLAGRTASLVRIAWEAGRVTMELKPSVSLAGHHVDFIALDGSVLLRLDFDDALGTANGVKRRLSWNVCAQPWKSGDLLMLRIGSSGDGLAGVTNDQPCPPRTS